MGRVVVGAVGAGLEAGREASVEAVAEVALAAAVAAGVVAVAVEERATVEAESGDSLSREVVEARRTSGSYYQADSARH